MSHTVDSEGKRWDYLPFTLMGEKEAPKGSLKQKGISKFRGLYELKGAYRHICLAYCTGIQGIFEKREPTKLFFSCSRNVATTSHRHLL